MWDWTTSGLVLWASEDGNPVPFLQLCSLSSYWNCRAAGCSLWELQAQHLHLAHHKVLTILVTAPGMFPGCLGSANWFNSSFNRKKKTTLILLFLFRSSLWPESLKGNRNRKISPLYSTFCILLFSLLKFIVKEVTGKWVWVLFAFLKLKPKPFSHWAFSGDLSEAAVKTGTKGLQRKMEGKGSWSFSLLCSECGASFMSRGEVGRECVSEL